MTVSTNSMTGVGLVTGGASGIGAATVKALLDAGVRRVIVADRNEDLLNKFRAELVQTYPDADVEVAVVDVNVEEQVQAMVAQAVDKWGRIDYCLNSAGVAGGGFKIGETALEEYERVININERGTFLSLKHELAQMAKQEPLNAGPRSQRGAIVNIASIAGYKAIPGGVAYTTSKHAVVGMTKVAAVDYSGQQIRINAIAPGWIDTAMTRNSPGATAMLTHGTQPERCPAARPGQPAEMADVITFMLSEKASYVNGTTWQADGGLMTH
ncbi:hypothetical protein CcaverHIS002_0108650 [Cutaneotrichosporon cavernicola]|uniref:NAD(P)-binding protein n=1 Tax=Cutaneotrichosporon cavernicola TaxID=279322 RepID=A0AA48IC53_9TREE|nr:uncharacterized protein CcaverHIS019_0108590 [Cutaneotrichosporon cavernicola]BEI80336.1 hypothetical protein CcaverHIS002_0108650 [Cutaneotrichosporon cavernicola]BEI88141.1 hypothetical protein CcaverHIS019_0108590 [Cutaneotrichosporon cavernicola]BEI95911.1 hypothetical protein CcaverHIS631_0108600 [Cutaneotrichosporon cavernicola]BEJ03686.1 hypothetical protein CcaverHIS641_0108610 [Cutaneotrichosporon cavernicola]